MSELRLSWARDGDEDSLRIEGCSAAGISAFEGFASERLSTHLALLPLEVVESAAALESLQPIAGTFKVDRDTVWFRPRFPFRDGVTYVLFAGGDEHGWRSTNARRGVISRPASAAVPSTLVSALHPEVDEVPLNLLKFYVEFSAPMSEGGAARAIRLLRAESRAPLEDVFAPMALELWDPAHRRLTVLLDPGRIKRGLIPNAEQGYPLTEGQDIRFCIDRDFRDAAGQPLAEPFERTYLVGPAIRQRVQPNRWQILCPRAGSDEPLSVSFERPLDHALLRHRLRIVEAGASPVPGDGRPGPGDTTWQFTPQQPWRGGPYHLAIDPILEDLAGNSVARLFDHDLEADDSTPIARSRVFHVK